jgi:hypothetical protein
MKDEYIASKIKTALSMGTQTHAEIANSLGISKFIVDNISAGKTWNHV